MCVMYMFACIEACESVCMYAPVGKGLGGSWGGVVWQWASDRCGGRCVPLCATVSRHGIATVHSPRPLTRAICFAG